MRYIRRYKLKQLFRTWVAFYAKRRRKQASIQHANAHYTTSLLIRSLARWMAAVREQQREAAVEHRTKALHKNRRRTAVLIAWKRMIGRNSRKLALLHGADEIRAHRLLRLSLISWVYFTRLYKSEKRAVAASENSLLAVSFILWQQRTALRRHIDRLVESVRARHAASLQNWTMLAWVGYVEGKRARLAHEFQTQLSLEVERLRQDNERLARVVDSGDWNRDRVAELTQAGQVLQQERDALVKLVESLPGAKLAARRASRLSTVQPSNGTDAGSGTACTVGPAARKPSIIQPPWDPTRAKMPPVPEESGQTGPRSRVGSILAAQNSSGLASLNIVLPSAGIGASTAPPTIGPGGPAGSNWQSEMKKETREEGQSAVGGPTPNPLPARIPANMTAKMTVRAGSSFNALVRALKQDLLTSGALARGAGAAVAVDKVSI